MNNWQNYVDIICHDFDTTECGVKIGNSVVCDGYVKNSNVAVFSHYHSDHIKYFQKTLTTCDKILASKITYDALVAIYGKYVGFRQNFQALDFNETYTTDTGEKITLYPSNHVPGSAQIFVETHDGTRILYSGDFNYPNINVPKCDILVLDSTHGDKQWDFVFDRKSVLNRIFDCVENELMLNKKPIVIKASRGVLQLIMETLEKNSEGRRIPNMVKFLADQKDVDLTAALNPYLSTPIRPVLYYKNKDALKLRNSYGPYVLFRVLGSNSIPQEESMRIIQVEAYSGFKDRGPFFEESNGLIRANLSSHASFSNILKYIETANPRVVITDNSRGQYGSILAQHISQKFGILAFSRPIR